jgi:acyl-coenzyme A thioesterase PaaI-like protein
MSADNQKDCDQPMEIEQISAFNHSEFAQLLGMEITDAYDGYACVVMDCTGKNNPRGVAHGGAIFALADQVFGIAANCATAIRVADNGRYFTFRVIVYEKERIIAEFDCAAIQVDTPPL